MCNDTHCKLLFDLRWEVGGVGREASEEADGWWVKMGVEGGVGWAGAINRGGINPLPTKG
jgi:hypothetical protein